MEHQWSSHGTSMCHLVPSSHNVSTIFAHHIYHDLPQSCLVDLQLVSLHTISIMIYHSLVWLIYSWFHCTAHLKIWPLIVRAQTSCFKVRNCVHVAQIFKQSWRSNLGQAAAARWAMPGSGYHSVLIVSNPCIWCNYPVPLIYFRQGDLPKADQSNICWL